MYKKTGLFNNFVLAEEKLSWISCFIINDILHNNAFIEIYNFIKIYTVQANLLNIKTLHLMYGKIPY